jgi:hypothetical protein
MSAIFDLFVVDDFRGPATKVRHRQGIEGHDVRSLTA